MTHRKAFYLSALMILLLSTVTILSAILIVSINQHSLMKEKLKTSEEIICLLENHVEEQNLIISAAHNSAVKFEMLVGVKEPDGIITYREKCLITAKRMNKIKNAKIERIVRN